MSNVLNSILEGLVHTKQRQQIIVVQSVYSRLGFLQGCYSIFSSSARLEGSSYFEDTLQVVIPEGGADYLRHMAVAGSHGDAEGYGRAAGETVVLFQVDGLVGELLHVEGPEQTSDSQENLLLCKRNTGANTTTIANDQFCW